MRLDAHDCHHNRTLVWGTAVFKQENPLPGPEQHSALCNWDDLASAGQHHSQMRRHIIGTFVGVDEIVAVFGGESFEEGMEVRASRGIRVFVNHEAGTGVLNEDGHGACLHTTLPDQSRHFCGNFVGTFAGGWDSESGGFRVHVCVLPVNESFGNCMFTLNLPRSLIRAVAYGSSMASRKTRG